MGSLVFMLYGALFVGLTVRHVCYGLFALICMFAFEQWGGIHIPFVAQNGSLVNLGILLLVGFAWFRVPTGSTFEFLVYPVRLMLLLLLGYALLSTLWAPTDAKSAKRFFDFAHYLVVAILIAPLLVLDAKDFTKMLNAVTLFGGILVILFAFVPSFEGRSLVSDYDLEETVALPLTLSGFAGSVMIITFLRMRFELVQILWALLVFGSAMFLISKTGSRGQFFFALAALLICLPARWKRFSVNKFFVFVLLALIAFGAFIVVTTTENTLSSRLDTGDSATDSRVRMISILLEAWASDPVALVFGLGSSASWSQPLVQFYPHVVPLEILGELGFIGFTLFALVVVSLFLKAFSGAQKSKLTDQSLMDFAALFGAFVFALLISCKQGSFLNSSDIYMFAVLAEKCFFLGQSRVSRPVRRKRMMRPAAA